jgi:hypothetical protein
MYILLDTACSTIVDSGACLINHIKKKKRLAPSLVRGLSYPRRLKRKDPQDLQTSI